MRNKKIFYYGDKKENSKENIKIFLKKMGLSFYTFPKLLKDLGFTQNHMEIITYGDHGILVYNDDRSRYIITFECTIPRYGYITVSDFKVNKHYKIIKKNYLKFYLELTKTF